VSLFWFKPPASFPTGIGWCRRKLIDATAAFVGVDNTWSWVILSVILGGVLPSFILLLLRKRMPPSFLDKGTRIGWKLVSFGYLVAFGALFYLASRTSFRDYYVSSFRQGLTLPALRFGVVVVAEHICIQGLVFRMALGDSAAWPAKPTPPTHNRVLARFKRMLGLGASNNFCALFGVDSNVLWAMAAQAWVFGWVHFSKDVGELLMSFPGGFALGYLAWRAQSVWPCIALHVLTGATVIAIAILVFAMPLG
jgi:membrane protease YdiL (CAAX protease family)